MTPEGTRLSSSLANLPVMASLLSLLPVVPMVSMASHAQRPRGELASWSSESDGTTGHALEDETPRITNNIVRCVAAAAAEGKQLTGFAGQLLLLALQNPSGR